MAAYLTATAAKARDPRLKVVEDSTIDAYVAAFEDIAERYRGVAFTSRTATGVTVRGTDRTTLVLPHVKVGTPTAIAIDGTAFTSDERADVTVWADEGTLYRDAGWCGTQVVLSYPYGYSTTPAAILDACTEYVISLHTSRQSGASRNTLSVSTDVGTTRYSTPDWNAGRPTGWLEVDRLLNSVPDFRIPGVG